MSPRPRLTRSKHQAALKGCWIKAGRETMPNDFSIQIIMLWEKHGAQERIIGGGDAISAAQKKLPLLRHLELNRVEKPRMRTAVRKSATVAAG
ncbi:hypothetical protein ACSSV6_003474 [Roseovarius sp. MBR-38]